MDARQRSWRMGATADDLIFGITVIIPSTKMRRLSMSDRCMYAPSYHRELASNPWRRDAELAITVHPTHSPPRRKIVTLVINWRLC
jgi:hypothetical protein